MRNPTLVLWLAGSLMLATACGDDDGGQADAAHLTDGPTVDAPLPDAESAVCQEYGFTAGGLLTRGADDDLFTAGPGAWVGHSADHPAPGEILYVEAYDNYFDGDQIVYTQFKDWSNECDVCVFFGTQCDPYQIDLTDEGEPDTPIPCQHVFMLARGQIDLTAFDPSPSSPALAGTIVPTGDDPGVELVEITIGENDYGYQMTGGGCVELPSLAFDSDFAGGDGDGDGDGD